MLKNLTIFKPLHWACVATRNTRPRTHQKRKRDFLKAMLNDFVLYSYLNFINKYSL